MLTNDNAGWITSVTVAVLAVWAGAGPAAAQTTGTSSLILRVAPQCVVSVLSDAAEGAGSQARVVTFVYKIRTGKEGGSGHIAMRLAGPVAEGAVLEYRTELEGPGTAASGTVPGVSAEGGVVVARFGERASSTRAGATGRVRYALAGQSGATTPPAGMTIGCE